MKVIDLVKCLGTWNRIQIQDWNIADSGDDDCILFKGYAEDCPYKWLDLTLVNPEVTIDYDNSPLNIYIDNTDGTKGYLVIWITSEDDLKMKD